MASLNKVILMGNLTADPELRTTSNGVPVTAFSIAVGRRFARETDEVKADFINIVCWRNNAEFVTKYFSKGKPIVVVGSLQSRSYTAQDGSKRYITEVVADEITFAGPAGGAKEKGEGTFYGVETPGGQPRVPEANFEEVAAEDDLPF